MTTHPWWPAARTALCAVILAGCAEKQAVLQAAPVAPRESTAHVTVEPVEAKVILMGMAKFLARTPRFSVNLRGSYDVVQDSGQKIEFGETRKIIVSRPGRLRVEVEHSNGEKHLVLYDGKEITAFSPSQNVYAQAAKPGGIDQAVRYFLQDLHMRLPLAALLLSRLPDELEQRTHSLDYVEKTLIQGAPAHHLAGRTETVDYQLWIAEGGEPLPLRVVLTYKNAEGQPEFRAQFSEWNRNPDIRDAEFAFTPPTGARKISFLAQLPEIAPQGAISPEQTGGQR